MPDNLIGAGAHELAPNPADGTLKWERRFGVEAPSISLGGDLIELNDTIKEIIRKLKAEGTFDE